MSLGSRIYEQRSAHSLSQVDLADLLEVSRQSVSKWETDASVPDLDKLVKMCEIFQVSMDWLVLGKDPPAPPAAPPPAAPVQFPPLSRQTVGAALIAVGFLALIVVTAAKNLSSGIFLALPFLACGGLCFVLHTKRWLFLWCGWFVWAVLLVCVLSSVKSDVDPISTLCALLAYGGFSLLSFLALLELIGLVVLLFFTFGYDYIFPPDHRKTP